MPIRFSCSACGKKLKVKVEYAGRQSKCPACGWGIFVPIESTWEEDDSSATVTAAAPLPPPVAPSPVPPPVRSVLARAATVEGNSEAEPQKPKKGGNQRVGKWIIATAALVGPIVLVLMAAGGYGRPRMAGQPAAPNPVPEPLIAAPEPLAPTQKPVSRFAPAIIERLAQIYPERTARIVFGKGEGVEGVTIHESHVRRAEPDPRKIPWLWVGEVTFEISYTNKSDPTPVRVKMLYHLSPEGEEWECWRDVTILIGDGFTRHNDMEGSEWTRDFRKLVVSEWKQSFDFYKEGTSAEQRSRDRLYREKVVAEKLGITVVEFEEILETTD